MSLRGARSAKRDEAISAHRLLGYARNDTQREVVMSIHSSLRTAEKGRRHRSVLKRYERLKVLKDKNLWDENKSVLGIPKVKMQKMKVKKEKAAAPEAEVGTVAAPVTAGKAAPTPPAAGAVKSDKK